MLKRLCVIMLAILPGIGVLLLARYLDQPLVNHLTREDGLVENLSAAFYLAGFIFCFYRLAILEQTPRAALVLWLLLCFFFFGEETSWLQRVIGFETPEGIENTQDEFNLHNLEAVQFIVTTDKGYPILGAQNLFRLGFVSYFIILPIMCRFEKMAFIRKIHFYPLPGRDFIISVASLIAITFVFTYFADSHPRKSAIAEIHEMFYAFIIMYYIAKYLSLTSPAWKNCRG